ncbi:MAG: hypothetical protein LBH43_19165 [Treponema sp.]|jgi:uncharacterized protein (TIGR03545 family)|nr:hypothetical protein [Treponema sp.]
MEENNQANPDEAEKEAPKNVNSGKAPRVFRKPIEKGKFEKKFAKYIEHPVDKKFFIGSFELREDVYVLREGLGKDENKKLKMLLGLIKKNRKGPVNVIPLAFAAILVGSIIVFTSIFANPLLGKAMEMGLEAAFEARCNVKNFRLSLLRFRITIGGITVANRDSPMKNLFEMGEIRIWLKSQAVLRGKIYIEDISVDTMRFGTDRTVSGALPARPAKVKPEKPKTEAPPLVDLQNFDAMALLDQEFDKLKTPKLYDEAVAVYNETLEKWQGQADLIKTRSGELKTQVQPILNINVTALLNSPDKLKAIEEAKKAVQDITTLVNTVQTSVDDATKIVNGLDADIKTAQRMEQNARTAISGDIEYLKSYIDLGSGSAFAALEPSIRDILSNAAEQYMDYGIQALEMLQKLKAEAAAKPKKEKPPKKVKNVPFKGRDVAFPTRDYPAFYLDTLASNITVGSINGKFKLSNISSDPDLTYKQHSDKPDVKLVIDVTEENGPQRQLAFNGSADFRKDATERFGLDLKGKGFPVELGDQLSKVGINGFNGTAELSFNMSGYPDGGASGGGDIRISQARLVRPEGTLAEAVDTAIRQAGLVNLGLQYTHWADDRADELKLTTNIADLVARALRNAVSAYTQKALNEVERALRAKIDQYIDGKFVSKDEVDALLKMARGDKDALDQVKNSLNSKKTEYEQKLKAAADQAAQQVKDEVKQQGQQALQDVLQGKQPSLNLPSTGGLKLPGF